MKRLFYILAYVLLSLISWIMHVFTVFIVGSACAAVFYMVLWFAIWWPAIFGIEDTLRAFLALVTTLVLGSYLAAGEFPHVTKTGVGVALKYIINPIDIVRDTLKEFIYK